MYRRSLFIFILLFAAVPLFTFAQFSPSRATPPTVVLENDPRAARAEVYAHDLIIDQVIYGMGETVTGSFTLTNHGETSISDVYYAVELVGNFNEHTLPTTVYDFATTTGPLIMAHSDQRRISFSYKLPELLPTNNLGIQIKVYDGNTRILSRASIPFGVAGDRYDYLEHITQIQVDGEPFGLLDAPTVYDGERILFAASLKNGGANLELTPHVEIYDRLLSGRRIEKYEATSFSINRFATKEQRIELPTYGYKPAIYTALITYKDEDGLTRSGPFEIRYVVSELRPKIESIGTYSATVEAGDEAYIFFELSDAPIDIRTNNFEESRPNFVSDMELAVTIYDGSDTVVAKDMAVIEPAGNEARFSFVANKDLAGFRVVADLLEDGELVDRHEKAFMLDENEAANFLARERGDVLVIGGILFGIIILILLAVYIFLKKKRAAAALVLLLIAAPFHQSIAETFVRAFGERAVYIPTNFQINSPLPSEIETYSTGQIIPFQIDVWTQGAHASARDMEVRSTSMLTLQESIDFENYFSDWQQVGTTRAIEYTDQNIPWTEALTIQAPETEGTYRVYFEIKQDVSWTIGQTYENAYTGYIEVYVREPLPEAVIEENGEVLIEAEVVEE